MNGEIQIRAFGSTIKLKYFHANLSVSDTNVVKLSIPPNILQKCFYWSQDLFF